MQPNIIKETIRGIQLVSIEDEMLNSRELFLNEEVSSKTSTSLIKQLMYLEKQAPGEPITLYINSPGGEVVSGLALYDYIQLMSSPVYTVCIGTAASMAAILFLAGEKRKMMKNTQLMIHDPSYASGDVGGAKPHEIQEKLDKLMETQKKLAHIIAERTGLSIKQVYRKTKHDTYIGAEEALKLGLATEIMQ